MDLPRRLSHTLLSISTVILIHAHFATTNTMQLIDTLASYTDPEDRWMSKVVVDLDDNVYVVATNVLFHFSSKLELKETVIIGPVEDHPNCLHPSYPCSEDKVSTDTQVNVLHVIYNLGPRPCLLLCGNIYRRLCQIRPVDNLTEYHWIHPFNQSVDYSGSHGDVNVFSYFGPGYGDQQTLITGISMEDAYKDNHFGPFLSSKVIEKDGDSYNIRYSFENTTAKSALEFSTWSERLIQDGGLVYEGFIYFLILYTAGSEHAKLVRVCIQDGTFQSYSELPIACDHPNGQFYVNAYAIHLDDSPSSDAKSLYVIFNRGIHKDPAMALCIFPMSVVIHAFTTFPKECLRVVGQTCQQEMIKDIKDFCGSDVRPYSVTKPLVVPHFKYIPEITVSVIMTVKHHNEMVAIIVDKFGDVRKISLKTGEIISKNRAMSVNSTNNIFTRLVFDQDHQHVYILKESEIVKFPVASCRVHETCESCFIEGKNDPLNCGWCGEYCAHSKECKDSESFSPDACTPSISEVSPLKGPIQGHNMMEITGKHFGSYVDGGHYSVTVAGIPCKILQWQNKKVSCMLGPTPVETSDPVKLNAIANSSSHLGYNIAGSTTSHLNFNYYSGPRLFGIHPNKGPTSGGTIVYWFGENLDFEKTEDRSFIVQGRPCNLKGFNSTSAWCQTSDIVKSFHPARTAMVVRNITYVIDQTPSPTFNHTELYQSFEYTPDPEILEIKPGITTVSGLMNVTAMGLYLDSVLSPKIVVKVSLSTVTNLEFIEECWSDPESKGAKLTCSTPSFVDELWLPKPTSSSPLLTHVSFIMDGVQWLREFSKHQEFISRLLYFPDPEFKPFDEIEKIGDDQTWMEIKGNNLDIVSSVNNFHIKLGENDSCEITTVSTEFLVCNLPPSIQNSAIGTNISVEAFIGSTSHHLGYIEIVSVKWNKVIWKYILLAIYIVGPLVVIMVLFLCLMKIRKKKLLLNTSHDISLSKRTEASHDNPHVHPIASLSEESTAEPSEKIGTLDRERMFIFKELGLIIEREYLIIGEIIGSGQFGKVFKGILQIPNQKEKEIAVKTLYRHLWRNPMKAELFMKEALTMKDFVHPHVLGLLGVCFEGSVPLIILPFMENGDLSNYIRDKTKDLLISDLLKFAVDVASGMCYLAKLKFVHRDLAARNCVLDSSVRAKVADFGLSRDIYEGNYYRCQDKHAELPFRWAAPEVIESQISTTQSDVWSYGVLLWELMTRGCIPYANIGNWDVLTYIKLGNRLDQPQFCPMPLYFSMVACWNLGSEKRPNFFKLHSYISKIHGKLLNDTTTQASLSFTTVGEDSMHFHSSVPAQNTVYYDSKELYLKLEGHELKIEDLEEIYV